MHMLKSSLPDDAHPDMALRVPAGETPCGMATALRPARAGISRASSDAPSGAEDHAFGGCTGI